MLIGYGLSTISKPSAALLLVRRPYFLVEAAIPRIDWTLVFLEVTGGLLDLPWRREGPEIRPYPNHLHQPDEVTSFLPLQGQPFSLFFFQVTRASQ